MSDLTILVDTRRTAEQGLSGDRFDHIDVQWNPSAVVLAPEAAAHLEARWAVYLQEAQAQGKSLFNGSVTRLIEARRNKDRVWLHLGPSDYKTFLVTRMRDRAWFEANAPEAMARALGNSVLLTRADQALLGVRSAQVSAYPHRAHLLGGVLDLLGTERFPAIAEGLVAHLLLELHEEAGVATTDLESPGNWPRLLAVAHDEFLGQPEALWQWESTKPLEAIGAGLAALEHSAPLLLNRGVMDDPTWERMTPVARLAWKTWSDQ